MSGFIGRLAHAMALLGGIVLLALVLLTCISVLGRGLNTLGHSDLLTGMAPDLAKMLIDTGVGPVTGDFELVEAGVAFAIFAFLPIAQYRGAHATVDIFTGALPAPANRALIAFWEVVLTAVILLITWRLFVGMQSKMAYGETTFLLQFPIWWAYAASVFAAMIASVTALHCAHARIRGRAPHGRDLPAEGAAS